MNESKPDPILAEVRRVREALAERFDGDLRRIAEYLNGQTQREGRKVVSYPPRVPSHKPPSTAA